MRTRVWVISAVLALIGLIGLVLCWINPEIGAPLRPGLDFTGGTQIQLERRCGDRVRRAQNRCDLRAAQSS